MTWHTVALVSFLIIAISLAATVMSSGFTSSDVTKDVLENEVRKTSEGLQIIGKISGFANVSDDKIYATATPITIASGGSFNVKPENFKLSYKLIKTDSYTITQDNIYVGTIKDGSFNSIKDAAIQAKKLGLIQVNPYLDSEKPDSTNAFIYWIINLNSNDRIETGELAVLAIIYGENDKPSTDEYLLIQGKTDDGEVLKIERMIPHISNEVVDMGGKLK